MPQFIEWLSTVIRSDRQIRAVCAEDDHKVPLLKATIPSMLLSNATGLGAWPTARSAILDIPMWMETKAENKVSY